ncbi:XdhC family protein [Paenibacillus sp. N3.4]|uniref:XdhC family protein n=1 Tax=Paenibacillus sp. N3.4 TaxID=2603222 RepID=UPI0021C41D41|nr:XdhC/CoxI family protein [Paenibacillus sp. N3.4]
MEAYDILSVVERSSQASVIATVMEVVGHAYRKQGAIMLLMEDGSSVGSISPGCLEADLAEYRSAVWESQKPQVVEYDMRPVDDMGWGETIGCGGLIRVLLEPIAGELLVHLLAIKTSLDRGEAIQLVRTFTDGYSNTAYELLIEGEAIAAITPIRGAVAHTFCSLFAPKPRVVIFGANDDAIPLAQMAVSAGFRVVVADWRDTFCTVERFPGASTVVAFPERLINEIKLNNQDYVVVMSHQFQKDADFVNKALGSPLRYLGIMGSRQRTEKMIEGLERPDWLHYPIGLRIGSEGPVENAVSVLAELISIRRGVNRMGERSSSLIVEQDVHGYDRW